ncbi:hypothetical protein D0Z07_7147 [Hyphodiscus hymeniophilus]|uniref:Uncharacterized protein n=1 Tax=Hyphodiscus hymeniophilus TaxID=353542 RepID=A0A9P6VGI4_9HELO|nr:hypothetical protein D0Z07_7147 [Hyphodiscus hymeniophilus]
MASDLWQPGPSELVGTSPSTGRGDSAAHEEYRKKDYIERNFGALEKSFIESARQASNPPKRSRDDSIRLIYEISGAGDWLDLIEGHDDHNPANCKGQKFLILNKFPGDDAYGLGAIIQRISDYLSIAVQTNSILLYAGDLSPGEHFIQDPTDGGDSSCGRTLDCIFQELSKCKSAAQEGLDGKVQSIFAVPNLDSEVNLDAEIYLAKHGSAIPPVFEAALRLIQPDITSEMMKYWWRAQAAAYIMRLNSKAASRMKELRLGKGVQQAGILWDMDGQPQPIALPFPMPEGTFSIHVRHGDKGYEERDMQSVRLRNDIDFNRSEMRLVPFNDYVVRAEKFSAENPLGTWKRAFLSTEDPNVIEQMKSMARITPFSYSGSNARWTWYWSNIPRLNTSPETQLREFGNRTDLTLKWMLQLVMAIECDAFVGTRGVSQTCNLTGYSSKLQ